MNQDTTTPGAELLAEPVEDLHARLRVAESDVERLRVLAESYRLAAKARAEEVTKLIRAAEVTPRVDEAEVQRLKRELIELRAFRARRSMRAVSVLIRPLETPYRHVKRAVRSLVKRNG